MKHFSIGQRLAVTFGVLICLSIGVGAMAIHQLDRLSQLTERMYRHPYTVGNAVRDVRANTIAIQGALMEIAHAEGETQMSAASQAISNLDRDTMVLFNTISQAFLGDPEDVENARLAFIRWKPVRDRVLIMKRLGQTEKAMALTRGDAADHMADINAKIEVMIDFARGKADAFLDHARRTRREVMTVLTLLVGFSVMLIALVGISVTRGITRPIFRLNKVAAKIAEGRTVAPQEVERQDEIGDLATAFNRIIASNNTILTQAKAISVGDYESDLALRSEADELGQAIAKMTASLRSARDDSRQQEWFQKGETGLNDCIRGDKSIADLCRDIVTYLAKYLEAPIGAIYLTGDDRHLQLVGSYAFTIRKTVANRFDFGEGLVGQAALENETIVLTDPPEEYIRIASGLGHAPPKTIVVVPFSYEDRVVGVLEIGMASGFADQHLAFLKHLADAIGIAVSSAQARKKMAALLETTSQQTEQLQIRERELEQSNQVLAEQTRVLKESEARLHEQQEELRQINEELQEQTQLLEEQKEATEKKNEQLRLAQEQIEEKAQAIELSNRYKSEFLANMSHELRTPLNSILLLSKLLTENRNGQLPEDDVESARAIYSSGSDLLSLINEILDLSKVEAGKLALHPEETPITEIGASLEQMFAPVAANKGLEFVIDVAPGLPASLYTDGKRVEQVLKNFLSNAFKFTQTGRIALEVGRPDPALDFSIHGLSPEQTVSLAVVDTGFGIPPEKQQLIFEAFQQADGSTSRKFGGTGLGLSISRELAALLGGTITMSSTPGQGSRFVLHLPEALDGTGRQTSAAAPHRRPGHPPSAVETSRGPAPDSLSPVADQRRDPAPDGPSPVKDDRRNLEPGDKRLLIIEDDPGFQRVLRDLARDHGFKCLIAENGETGLQFAEYYHPSAVILDVRLPGINGWTVMTRLKENLATRHIPVHFLSASDRQLDALRMGAVDFVSKPVTPEVLSSVFDTLDRVITKTVKKLLIVEDDQVQQQAIAKLIANDDLEIDFAASGSEATTKVPEGHYDCMILDLGLPDMSGVDLLRKLKLHDELTRLPIIIYTGRELTAEELAVVDEYGASTIIKGVNSHQKLLDETTLFLHRVEKDLEDDQRQMLRRLHDREAIFNGKTVLVVDDDMRNVFSLKKILQDKGIAVLVGKNGKDGLETLERSDSVDLVLMDIMMPEMDGYEAMRAIRGQNRFKDLPIIALTAKAMRGDRGRCIEAGASDYLPKPVDVDRLFSMLRVWLYR